MFVEFGLLHVASSITAAAAAFIVCTGVAIDEAGDLVVRVVVFMIIVGCYYYLIIIVGIISITNHPHATYMFVYAYYLVVSIVFGFC